VVLLKTTNLCNRWCCTVLRFLHETIFLEWMGNKSLKRKS
jgi:hypothetical protein